MLKSTLWYLNVEDKESGGYYLKVYCQRKSFNLWGECKRIFETILDRLIYINGMTIHLVVIYLAFCLNVAQGHMKGAPNETQTHSCRLASWNLLSFLLRCGKGHMKGAPNETQTHSRRFASRACLPLHHQRRLWQPTWCYIMPSGKEIAYIVINIYLCFE